MSKDSRSPILKTLQDFNYARRNKYNTIDYNLILIIVQIKYGRILYSGFVRGRHLRRHPSRCCLGNARDVERGMHSKFPDEIKNWSHFCRSPEFRILFLFLPAPTSLHTSCMRLPSLLIHEAGRTAPCGIQQV